MATVKVEQHWYEVRRGRILFFADPTTPGVDRAGNVWAKPGQYVEASHPILQAIIRIQTHKVRRLKEGETIPAGSLVMDASANPQISRAIAKYDGRDTDGGTRTPEEIVVGSDGGSAPTISVDPEVAAQAAVKDEKPAKAGKPGKPAKAEEA